VWLGKVRVWDNEHGVHGRRASGARKGQWQVNDVIKAPAHVIVTGVEHPSRPKDDGKYFFFSKDAWSAEFGSPPPASGANIDIVQRRDGSQVWQGKVRVWDNRHGVHGRRASGAEKGQWQMYDVISKS